MTKILDISSQELDMELIRQAADIINNKGTVAIPTETVYGLGADGLDEEAVKKIYIAKGRPSDNPLILHISNMNMLEKLVEEIPEKAKLLAKTFWPGPLTMIFKKSSIIPEVITAGLETVAIRMPSNNIARCLIEEANTPIAAPSANISGKPSPTKAKHVIEDLDGRIDAIITSDDSTIGLESTVIDLTEPIPTILRPGAITFEAIKEVIGQVQIDQAILHQTKLIKAKSPGMKYKHYAPKAPMKIIKGDRVKVVKTINELTQEYQKQGKKVGVLATEETKKEYKADKVITMGQRFKPDTIMAKLFGSLRAFDEEDIQIILSEGFSNQGKELAISNRLNKAAGFDIIEV
ncbi:L-threonylcarbamoyladenylate synthase [Alkalibaculum bacchi]|uniref:L-threonylcarbamoyladenylate synthase n=1 Tax=Alkalibaculum bacchi TaxID=645887 RepID=UPI0026ED08DD|nr:L-threonylcarbamoyladenylate synthase [Alkalibaculum bacchi]